MSDSFLWSVLVGGLLAAQGLAANDATPGPSQSPAAEPSGTSKPAKPAPPPLPPPTLADVAYGEHERQVLDFWKAPSDKPTPLVIYMHGGAWLSGHKRASSKLDGDDVAKYLAAGISIVSINYRYTKQALEAGVMPPVEWPMSDARRALQFVRSKAAEWNMDRKRIGASGTSAGGCTSLWLAFHEDMADPNSSDPVARESTRLWCAAVHAAQTSLDPQQMKDWTPNSRYGGHAFGIRGSGDKQFTEFLARREEVLPWIRQYSPIEQASADDPPVYLIYDARPALGESQKDPTHTANFGVKLQEKLRDLGVECELVYPGAPDVRHATMEGYLIDKLRK